MSECTSLSEFDEKWAKNSRISGTSLIDAITHAACAFCAEPDFMVHRFAETEAAYFRGAVCKHCRRGLRRIVNVGPIGWTQEFIQTCGPDVPGWMRKIRREA